jgi:hypothetical protein
VANFVEVNFEGVVAMPSRLQNVSDYVPAGPGYILRIQSMAMETSRSSGADLITLRSVVVEPLGHVGKFIIDRFPIGSESGLARFMALCRLSGLRVEPTLMNVDLDLFAGRLVGATLADNPLPATDRYPERASSQVREYVAVPRAERPRVVAAEPAVSTNGVPSSTTAAVVPQVEDEVGSTVDDFDEPDV